MLPDDEQGSRNFVMALFDSDPVTDLAQCARLGPPGVARVKQAVQLKSFAQRRPDGSLDRFVALLLPRDVAALATRQGPVAAAELQTDYDWVREYNSAVRYDEKGAVAYRPDWRGRGRDLWVLQRCPGGAGFFNPGFTCLVARLSTPQPS